MYSLYITSNNRADNEKIGLSFEAAKKVADVMISLDSSIVKIDLIKRHCRVATIYDAMNPQLDA